MIQVAGWGNPSMLRCISVVDLGWSHGCKMLSLDLTTDDKGGDGIGGSGRG